MIITNKLRSVRVFLFLSLFSISPCFGSGAGFVHFDTITMVSKGDEIEVKMFDLNEERIGVQIKMRDKIVKVAPKFLFDAEDVVVGSITLRVNSSNPGQEVDVITWGFYLVFEFGGVYEHGSKSADEPVDVYKTLILHFKDGQFVYSELAVPLGDFRNRWQFFERMPKLGEASEEPYFEDGVICPWNKGGF